MRTLLCVVATLLVAAPFADGRERRGKPAPDTRMAVVDDEPMSHAASEAPKAGPVDPLQAGARREIQVSAPTVQSAIAPKEPAHPTEHTVTVKLPEIPPAPTVAPRPRKVVELEQANGRREMRPYLGALGSCTQRKLRREPDARGTMLLEVEVGADQIAHARVTESTMDDAQLKTCLEGIVEGRTFGVGNFHFTWTVKIFPRTTVAAEP